MCVESMYSQTKRSWTVSFKTFKSAYKLCQLKYQLNPSWLMCHLRPLFPCLFFLSVWSTHWCQWGVKFSYYYCITVGPSLYVHQYLLYIFKFSYIGCINVYKRCVLLLDWSLYYYKMFFVSCFKVHFVWYKNIAISVSFFIFIFMKYIYPFLKNF